ncbi:nucleotide-binding universal stress UspA family protein [Paraburkholderia sp. HC6.4b]|uniref:universal stress protein n=1 Tax=unclassified Paraburkholderia TaxID=2615204 RepID=UPI00161E7ECE|nr:MULTISPECIES: universal stress protein [unclassified Paraburkholderia]MBB5413342.1 nucleotide-binding universal stress UspA family protein [Paraburkholderia sp. HC6.4b]MBB5455658.1 nucleotide-binding universal stress UspA family protein [Paraburkholderia sp. Kb1A]
MNTAAGRNTFHRVMIASAGGSGLPLGTRVARQLVAADARFRLVDIVCNPAALYPTLMLSYPDWCEAHRAMLHGAQAALRDAVIALHGVVAATDAEIVDLTALHQGAAEALAHTATQWDADLVAVAAHPREHRWDSRIDPEELVASIGRPVLYMPARSTDASDASAVSRVLVAIDGSDTALDALRTALAVAPPDARIKVVYAADDRFAWCEWLPFEVVSQHRIDVLRRGAAMLEQSRRAAETALLEFDDDSGDASSAILDEAQRWHADLIVMGSHGMRGAPHPLPGHVTSRTLRDAACPVLVCPRGASSLRADDVPHGEWREPYPGSPGGPFYL